MPMAPLLISLLSGHLADNVPHYYIPTSSQTPHCRRMVFSDLYLMCSGAGHLDIIAVDSGIMRMTGSLHRRKITLSLSREYGKNQAPVHQVGKDTRCIFNRQVARK